MGSHREHSNVNSWMNFVRLLALRISSTEGETETSCIDEVTFRERKNPESSSISPISLFRILFRQTLLAGDQLFSYQLSKIISTLREYFEDLFMLIMDTFGL